MFKTRKKKREKIVPTISLINLVQQSIEIRTRNILHMHNLS